MSDAIQTCPDHRTLIERAANTMLDGRWPQDSRDWQLIFNWIGLNVEGADAAAHRIAMAIWTVYGMPVDRGYLTAIIDHQRAERRRMGL